MVKSLVVFLFCVYASRCVAQVILPGACTDLPPKSPFDMRKFLGVWNQQESFGSNLFGSYGECSSANYTVNALTGTITIKYYQRVIIDQNVQTIKGNGVMLDPSKGKLLIYYYVPYHGVATAEVIIVDTDYVSWAILFSCTDLALGHASASWIMTRVDDLRNDPSAATINAQINAALDRVGFSRNNYITYNNHGECNDLTFN